MNIEKQTYLNTVRLEQLHEKSSLVTASFGAASASGGLRFATKGSGKVRLCADFRSLSGQATLLLDGLVIAPSANPRNEVEIKAEKGEHVFEVVCASTHGAFRLSAEGVGVEKSRGYLERVGGTESSAGAVVYLKKGKGKVEKHTYDGTSVSAESLNYTHYDEAYLYDEVNEAYTATKRYTQASTASAFSVYTGQSNAVLSPNFRSVAMCDGRTLGGSPDFLVAYVDQGFDLHFLRVTDGGTIGTNDYSSAISGILSVVSASKGSVFLVEDREHFWTGYFFHADGQKTLTFPTSTLKYDEIPLGKNRLHAPTATVGADGTPTFYYGKEDGRLMCLPYEGTASAVSYAEAYHAAGASGLLQLEGELIPYTF